MNSCKRPIPSLPRNNQLVCALRVCVCNVPVGDCSSSMDYTLAPYYKPARYVVCLRSKLMFICGYYTQRRPTRSKYVLNVSFGLVNLRARVLPLSNGKHTRCSSVGVRSHAAMYIVCIVTTAHLLSHHGFSFSASCCRRLLYSVLRTVPRIPCACPWWHDFGWGFWFSFYNSAQGII